MNKKQRRVAQKSILVILGIGLVAGTSLFYFQNELFPDDSTAFVFTLPDFALIDQSAYTCYFKSSIYYNSEKGKSVEIPSAFFTKAPKLVANELTERNNIDNTINNFEIYPKIKCDYLNDKKNSGATDKFNLYVDTKSKFTLSVIGTNKAGNNLGISPITKSAEFGQKLCDYCGDAVMAIYRINANDIDKLYESAPQPYTKDLTFALTGDLYLKNGFGYEYYMKIDTPVTAKVFYTVNKISQITPPKADAPLPKIDKITQTTSGKRLDDLTTKIDTTLTNGRQISVYATIDKWTESQGYPIAKIYKCNVSTSCTQFIATITMGKDGTAGKFVGRYTMPQNSANGIYQITVARPELTDVVASKTFEVKNSAAKPPSATPGTGGSGGTTQPTESIAGKFGMKYQIILASKTLKNDVTQTGGYDVVFTPLQFVKYDGDRFIKMLIEPIFWLEKGSPSEYSTTVSNLSYKGTLILPNTEEITIQGFGGSGSNRITKDSSGYYHFPMVELNYDMIERSLRDNSKISQTEKTDLTLRISINGDFDLVRQIDNKKFRGVVNDAGFAYFIDYDPSVPYDPKEKCQGLSGEALIECSDEPLPPEATGGECKGLTHEQCLATKCDSNFFGISLCPTPPSNPPESPESPIGGSPLPPVDKGGTVGICGIDKTSQQCVEELTEKAKSQAQAFGFDPVLIIVIVLLIVAIVAIILIAKHHKKEAF